MIGRRPPEEQRFYQQGYNAGRRRLERETAEDRERADAAVALFELLVSGLVLRGVSLDEILDAQLAGAKARQEVRTL